tara:strand:+ start:157 stop:315 length:159 start_codon:yes stop_codon:yes gene_type:complete
MKLFKYFSVSDKSKEAVGKVAASNKSKAIEKAAGKKRMDIEQFLTLFALEEI